MKIHLKTIVYITLLLFATGCSLKKEVRFSGKTMGTTYQIRVIAGYFKNLESLGKKIETRLATINQTLSVYIEDSEISHFNALRETGKQFQISDDFVNVITVARRIYNLTSGALDATVNPLVNIWGFGSSERGKIIPAKKDIAVLLKDIGFMNIILVEKRYLVKKNPDVSLDFGSIAKGYAVDQLVVLLHENGIKDCLVEIGGEVFASGVRKDGSKWKIGINTPDKNAPNDQVYRTLSLQDKGLATSGDYRNFFEKNGKLFSHIIDPRTGFPVNNGVVSVSIIADTCTVADGLATAIMVLGAEKGLELIKRMDSTECLIITRNKDRTFSDIYSEGFKSAPYSRQ
jgi:thiamine biosynthesis lipoprotein